MPLRTGYRRFISLSKGSLRLRAIAWFFLPTAVILVAVVLVNFYSYQDVTEELVVERGQDLPRASASRLASDLEEHTDLLADVVRDEARNWDATTNQQDVLDRVGGRLLVFDGGAVILDTFGKVAATRPKRPELMGLDWSDRSYFRQMVRDRSLGYSSPDPIFSNILDDGSQGPGTIAVAVPIINAEGEFLGSIVGSFSLSFFNNFYSRIVKLRIGGSGSTYLVDGDGQVIYHSDSNHIGSDFSTQPPVERIFARQAGNIRTRGFDGEDIVASFAPVPGTPWGLVTEESWTSLIGTSQGYRRFLLLLLGLGVAVPVLFVVFGVRHLMRPLKDLTIAARQMAKGEFDEPIAVQSGDEIKQLAEEFNVMASALKDRTEELTNSNESLGEANRRLEETLAELQSAQEHMIQQERLKALGTMASGIAHDFNNALGPIVGYSDILLTYPETLDDKEKTTQYVRTMNTSAKDAAAVVDRLRDFYRYREDKELLQQVDLNHIVREAISLSQPRWKGMAQAEGLEIDLQPELAPDLPLIQGDESGLRSVLTNLIFNAVDAMPDGGILKISTQPKGDWIEVAVSDTGTGMTEDVRKRALEPFFTTKSERGTGLGLAPVSGIVGRYGGRVEIESELGKGSVFTVRLPLPSEIKGTIEETEEEKISRSLHVLVAEDAPDMGSLLNDYLTSDGHTVQLATDGRAALKNFEAGAFDLVVTDRGMPHLSGDQLAEAIRAISDVPIIMVTGFGGMMMASGERPTGVDFILSKPVAIASLRKAIVNVLKE